MSSGAPLVTLRGLQLRNQVVIDGGVLQIEDAGFENCSAEMGGALKVIGGVVKVDSTTFVGCSATRGGGVHVSGGKAVFSGCTFQGCNATEEDGGGALWVGSASTVMLKQASRLYDNTAAGTRNSIHIKNGSMLEFVLPAPRGYYIDTSSDKDGKYDKASKTLQLTNLRYADYPHQCLPGLSGSSNGEVDQASTICSGLCPPRFTCGSYATVDPLPCEMGGYCPEGSYVARPCPIASFGNETKLSSEAECHACPPGVACTTFATASTECAAGTVQPSAGQGACVKCEAGKYQSEAGGLACIDCLRGHYCPPGAAAALPCKAGTFGNETKLSSKVECHTCPPGAACTTGGTAPTECAAGTVQPSAGQGACETCEAGKYQSEKGQFSCSVCGAGNYSSNVLSCEPCQVGEYCSEGSAVGKPCQLSSTTEGRGAKTPDECGCRVGTYNNASAGNEISCTTCNDGMLCTRTGLTLATIPLLSSRWRLSNRTADIKTCDKVGSISPCLGGVDSSTYCANGVEGPRCEWCTDPDTYYDDSAATCTECGDVGLYIFRHFAVLVGIIIALSLLWFALVRMPRLLTRVSIKLAQLVTASQQFGIQAKCASHGRTRHPLPSVTNNLFQRSACAHPQQVQDHSCPSRKCSWCARASMASLCQVGSAACCRCSSRSA